MKPRKKINLDGIFSSPWTLWAVSIVISVMMWVYVTGMDEASSITRKFTCPVEYRGLDAQAILRRPLSEVDIEIRGTEAAVTQLDYSLVKAYVDARNLLPGKRYTVGINVEFPETVSLVSVYPSQAVLDIAREVTRLMTVETVLPANIPEGYYIDLSEIIPREVGVRGTEDDIAKIGSVRITPSLDELRTGTEQMMSVKVVQSEPFSGIVAIEPPQVRFHGSLLRGLPRKRVPVYVRLAGRTDEDYEISSIATEPSEVLIEGEASRLSGIEAVDTDVIDISLMDADRVIIAPLRVPETEGVTLPTVSSVKVSIHLSEARAERMISHIPVQLRGGDTELGLSATPSSVSVAIEGRPSLMRDFDAVKAGLSAYVDMTNVYISPVMLPVHTGINSPDIFRVTRVEPANITVR